MLRQYFLRKAALMRKASRCQAFCSGAREEYATRAIVFQYKADNVVSAGL